MFQFFRVSSRAATRQIIAVTAITTLIFIVLKHPSLMRASSSATVSLVTDSSVEHWQFVSQFVAWSELALAVGFSLTCTRGLDVTPMNLKLASRRISPRQPSRPLKVLASLTGLSAVMCGTATLLAPPAWMIQGYADGPDAVFAASFWSGIASVAAAFFGSSLNAALRALN